MIIKKTTTVVTTTKTVNSEGQIVSTTETITASSDGDQADFEEIEEAVEKSNKAMDQLLKGFEESIRVITTPFDNLFRKKR